MILVTKRLFSPGISWPHYKNFVETLSDVSPCNRFVKYLQTSIGFGGGVGLGWGQGGGVVVVGW